MGHAQDGSVLAGGRITIRRVRSEDDARMWRDLAQSDEVGSLQQCLWWAEPLRDAGVRAEAIGIWRDERLIGGALFRSMPTPLPGARLTQCLSGPILLEWRPEWAEGFAATIEGLAAEHGSIEVTLAGCRDRAAHDDLLAAFRARGAVVSPARGPIGAVVPLRGATVETLRARMSESTRRNVRKGERAGLRLACLSETRDLEKAHASWVATARRKGFEDVRPWAYLRPVLERCLRDNLGAVLASYKDDRLLASIFVTFFGGRGHYVYGGFFDGAEPHSPNHLLHVEALRRCLDRGLRSYDLGELPGGGQPASHPLDRFKLGFGAIPQAEPDTLVWRRRPALSRGLAWLRRQRLGRALASQVRRRLLGS